MQIQKLIAAGLSEQQASAYALLIESGELTPPAIAKQLHLTRSNAYKVLDRLVEYGLAAKQEKNKKFTYSPTNPIALSRLAAEQRNAATMQENAAQEVISELLRKYRAHSDQPDVSAVSGRSAVAEAYRRQIRQKASIYFLRSATDIATMGFETMQTIRTEPERRGLTRYGITPDKSTTASKDSKLNRTWIRGEEYTAPVEWSVAGENLLIVVFGEEPHAVSIDNPLIAEAFRQIWHLVDSMVRAMPYYNELPR
jgi:sugar-specific transcriptional regulator TrmB